MRADLTKAEQQHKYLGIVPRETHQSRNWIHTDDQGLLQDCAGLEEPVESRLRLGLDLVHEYKLLEYDM